MHACIAYLPFNGISLFFLFHNDTLFTLSVCVYKEEYIGCALVEVGEVSCITTDEISYRELLAVKIPVVSFSD